jgi:hypothetical protein
MTHVFVKFRTSKESPMGVYFPRVEDWEGEPAEALDMTDKYLLVRFIRIDIRMWVKHEDVQEYYA